MKSFILLFLLSSTSWAYSLKSGMHHIEPLMKEAQEAVDGVNSPSLTCSSDVADPVRYFSDKPKTESWRSTYNMPKLLTPEFYQVKDVCEEAKKMNAAQGVNKKYAMVANKGHLCDSLHRACMSTFKSVADKCNYFIQDNFQVFHTRTHIGKMRMQQIKDEYGNMEPSMIVINLETCAIVQTEEGKKKVAEGMNIKDAVKWNYNSTQPSLGGADKDGTLRFKSDDDHVRFEAMREALTTNMPELKNLESKRLDCVENGKRTIPGMGDFDDVQYGDIKIKGHKALRKLIDEQYMDVTGINPFSHY